MIWKVFEGLSEGLILDKVFREDFFSMFLFEERFKGVEV